MDHQDLANSIEHPSSARVYDYMLGGRHNYAIDREFAERQLTISPDIAKVMRSNREFIARTVRYALRRGLRQFVDIGSGLPSQGQPHETADANDPDAAARVVYIDNEQIAHAHSEILLGDSADPKRHRAVFADFFDTEHLWEEVADSGVIDTNEPICLLMTALLHFMSNSSAPEKALAYHRSKVVPGSMLVLTHISNESGDPRADRISENYANDTQSLYMRSREEFRAYFDGWELVDPGIVWAVEWHPDQEHEWWQGDPARTGFLGGVGVKP